MYIIGNVMNILQNLCPATNEYKQTMDNLNSYMDANKFEKPMRVKLREYFQHSKGLFQANAYLATLQKLSPILRGEVRVLANCSVARAKLDEPRTLPHGPYHLRRSLTVTTRTGSCRFHSSQLCQRMSSMASLRRLRPACERPFLLRRTLSFDREMAISS